MWFCCCLKVRDVAGPLLAQPFLVLRRPRLRLIKATRWRRVGSYVFTFFRYRSRLFTVYQNIVCLTSASDLFVKSSKLSVSRLHKGTPSWLWLPAGSGITMASLSGQSILAALVIFGVDKQSMAEHTRRIGVQQGRTEVAMAAALWLCSLAQFGYSNKSDRAQSHVLCHLWGSSSAEWASAPPDRWKWREGHCWGHSLRQIRFKLIQQKVLRKGGIITIDWWLPAPDRVHWEEVAGSSKACLMY